MDTGNDNNDIQVTSKTVKIKNRRSFFRRILLLVSFLRIEEDAGVTK